MPGVKLPPNEVVLFHKALPNIKTAYVTLRKSIPDSQIFYTFLEFGLNVQVPRGKLPKMKQSFTQYQKCVYYSQKIYPRLPNILHLPSIWGKCTGAWGKITPNEKKLYPTSKVCILLSERKFTPDFQIYYTFLVFG